MIREARNRQDRQSLKARYNIGGAYVLVIVNNGALQFFELVVGALRDNYRI